MAGPNTAPNWSIARWNPKERPSSCGGTESATMASRGAVRTPFPNLSTKRAPSTCPQPPASASSGRDSVEIPYPKIIRGLRRPSLSLSHPAAILTRLAVDSAMPSISPMIALSTCSTEDRKMGTIE